MFIIKNRFEDTCARLVTRIQVNDDKSIKHVPAHIDHAIFVAFVPDLI